MTVLTKPLKRPSKRNVLLISVLCSIFLFIMYQSTIKRRASRSPISLVLLPSIHSTMTDSSSSNEIVSESNKLPENLQNNKPTIMSSEENLFEEEHSQFSTTLALNQEYELLQNFDNIIIEPKKILIWSTYWGSKAVWHKIFQEIVYKRCPRTDCELTTDRSKLNETDAVIFHLADVVKENYTFPEVRDPNQVWIGMTYEPPLVLKRRGLKFERLNGLFNRTMSYRTDGDIIVRHGTFLKVDSRAVLPSYFSNWVNSHETIKERNYAEGKRRLISWFASARNCTSQSGRENYVKELQNYIEVDVYGLCGPYKCDRQKTMRHPYKVEEDDCYMLVSIGYKFVLAFENSLCKDYVTEKLYNHLKLNVVPVVFGGSNYTQVAPPNSVIDATQYTPEELAKYLQILDKNDTLYNQYFEWKKDYIIEAHDGVPLACDLCEQLHNPNWQVERKVYDQFDKWITSGCEKGYGI